LLSMSPNIKAKEIAKKLGRSKTEINAFLYKNKDRYCQDDDHKWSLKGSSCRTILLQQGWITSELFEECLQKAGDVFDDSCDIIKIELPQGCKPMIDALARILSLMNQLSDKGKRVIADLTHCQETQRYLDRVGFFDLLHENIEVNPKKPSNSAALLYKGGSENLVELRMVDPKSDNDDLKNQLTKKFVNLSSNQYTVAAYTVFSELIDNVCDHSETSITGFAGLQKYGGLKDHIQIVISDSGIGIAKTLRTTLHELHPELHKKFSTQTAESDAKLISEVMSEGGISRFGEGKGLGFKSSKEQANKFSAQFTVRQEQFSLKFEFESGALKKITPTFDLSFLLGTHICFDFQVE